MRISFSKYEGTGNDFILIDNRDRSVRLNKTQIAEICDRHFGIGADGLMLLENEPGFDFRMVYYNSDGNESTMCGNGGRCIAAFAAKLGITGNRAGFMAIDGPHTVSIDKDGSISLQMKDVDTIIQNGDHVLLNTGSPHFVTWVEDIKETDVKHIGRAIRNRPEFMPDGININFVQRLNGSLYVRTYERGVEDETLSCGTGVTAAAIAAACDQTGAISMPVQTPGGELEVSFVKDSLHTAREVILKGPANFVFDGVYTTRQV